MKPSQIVTGAIDLLEQRGWRRGSLQGADGSLCAVGALQTATFGDPFSWNSGHEEYDNYKRAVDSLAFHINKQASLPGMTIAHWNDNRVRTLDQVIEVMHNTAVDLDRAEKEQSGEAV